MDNETWRWGWTAFTLIVLIGDIVIPGAFLLPIVLGGAAATVMAWLGVAVPVQWLAFFAVTISSYLFFRRYIDRRQEASGAPVGSNRWHEAEGIVLADIDPSTGKGTVRILNEEWRAVASEPIEAGAQIQVIEVSGTRVKVERRPGTSSM